jgi:deoxyadenosine/deoxycytidine kinase
MSYSKIISIEGNIGAGKTTLFDSLKSNYKTNDNIIFLDEPVKVWQSIRNEDSISLLELFYKDSHSYSFSFQMAAYISRLALLKETIEKNPSAIIITERSLNTDKHVFAKMLFEDSKIRHVDYEIYLRWFDTFAKDYPISNIVYVKTEPEICFDRIKQRSRQGESNIPIEYLKNCHEYHEKMIEQFNDKVTFINGNIDINENNYALTEWVQFIDILINAKYNT